MGLGTIEFKPSKSQGIQATFNSGSTTKIVPKSSNNNISANVTTVNKAPAIIDSSFNQVSSVMVAENGYAGKANADQKYNFLKYEIDNETGNYLVLINGLSEQSIYLYNKLGIELNHVVLPNELPSYDKLINKYLYIDIDGNLIWKTASPTGEEYFSGLAINIDKDNKINLLYDEDVFNLVAGKLSINMAVLEEKLKTKFALKTDLKLSAQDGSIEW